MSLAVIQKAYLVDLELVALILLELLGIKASIELGELEFVSFETFEVETKQLARV